MSAVLKYFIGFTMLWSTLLVGTNYFIDPIQFYRKSAEPVFILNQRYQIPGLIRNYPFDTIVIGTSHSENFILSALDDKIGTESLNLAISGSSALEQGEVIKLAAKKSNLVNVIWEMNYKSFAGSNPNLLKGGSFPLFLYEIDFSTHFYYLYSLDTLILSVKNILGKGENSLSGLNSWAEKEKDKFDGVHVVKHYCQRWLKGEEGTPVANYQKNLSEHLLPIIKSNQNTHFYLFIPPLSIANYALNNQMDKFISFRYALYQLSNQFENVEILDFAKDFTVLSNLINYKDVEHFSPEISADILTEVASNTRKNHKSSMVNELNEEFIISVENWKKNNSLCITK